MPANFLRIRPLLRPLATTGPEKTPRRHCSLRQDVPSSSPVPEPLKPQPQPEMFSSFVYHPTSVYFEGGNPWWEDLDGLALNPVLVLCSAAVEDDMTNIAHRRHEPGVCTSCIVMCLSLNMVLLKMDGFLRYSCIVSPKIRNARRMIYLRHRK